MTLRLILRKIREVVATRHKKGTVQKLLFECFGTVTDALMICDDQVGLG